MVETFLGEVVENKRITRDVYILKMMLDKEIKFQAGQFVNIEAMLETGRKMKPYSIASAPMQKDVLEFCIKKIEGGAVSTFLYNTAVGTKLKLMGPFGQFVLNNHNDTGVILIGTGTGIAPLKPMVEVLLENGYDKEITILFGIRYEEDVYYKEYFEQLEKDHPNVKFVPTLSKPGPEWKGSKGYVQDWLRDNVKYNGQHVYICGLIPMVEAVKKTCEELGFPKNHVHDEKYV